uniref:Uncharacterized protein n=1 Tax=Chaetoceros debilis TaxID=122233 RepID=A0A7S3PZG0_9STRA
MSGGSTSKSGTKKKGIRFWKKKKREGDDSAEGGSSLIGGDHEENIEIEHEASAENNNYMPPKNFTTVSSSIHTSSRSKPTNTGPKVHQKDQSSARMRSEYSTRTARWGAARRKSQQLESQRHATLGIDTAPAVSSKKSLASNTFTPRAVGPGTTLSSSNPSPTKWQEKDKNAKLQYMSHLHSISHAHVQDTPTSRKDPNIILQTAKINLNSGIIDNKGNVKVNVHGRATDGKGKNRGMTSPASSSKHNNISDTYNNDAGGPENNFSTPTKSKKHDQEFIDAILGVSPGCVQIPADTSKAIRNYASKPTSPTTVVNLDILKKGSVRMAHLAKDSFSKLMSCAADLNDLKNESDIKKDFCYAFENQNYSDDYYDRDYQDDDHSPSSGSGGTSSSARMRGRSRGKRPPRTGWDVDDDDTYTLEDGTFTGEALNVVDGGGKYGTSVSVMTQEEIMFAAAQAEEEEVLENIDHLKSRLKSSANSPLLKTKEEEENIAKRATQKAIESIQKVMEKATSTNSSPSGSESSELSARRRLQKASAAVAAIGTDLTSFKDLATPPSPPGRPSPSGGSSSSSGSRKVIVEMEVRMANPSTTNIPFDERSDVFGQSVTDSVYASTQEVVSPSTPSKSESKYNPIGRSFQNAKVTSPFSKKNGLLMNIPEDAKLTKTGDNREMKPSLSKSPRRQIFPHYSLQMEHGAGHSHAVDDLSVCTDERSM